MKAHSWARFRACPACGDIDGCHEWKSRRTLGRGLDGLTLDAVNAEVVRARAKFPGNRFLLAALTEEVGELAKAILQKRPGDEIEREAIQVACVALRIVEERDSAFDDVTTEESKP